MSLVELSTEHVAQGLRGQLIGGGCLASAEDQGEHGNAPGVGDDNGVDVGSERLLLVPSEPTESNLGEIVIELGVRNQPPLFGGFSSPPAVTGRPPFAKMVRYSVTLGTKSARPVA